jgi:hypothetical protein
VIGRHGADRLVAANAPFWAAEAELCRTYFESATRTLDTDLRWLALQASKELVDGVQARTDDPGVVAEEVRHLAAFTAAYDALVVLAGEAGAEHPPLTEDHLQRSASWTANAALRELRQRHRAEHGTLGFLAAVVTEGGAATLFREGAARAGLGPADDAIARACAAVLADEEHHAADALVAMEAEVVDDAGWVLATSCTVEQSRQRLHMRSEQFGHPVRPARFKAMLAGMVDPAPVLGVLR